MLRSFVVIAGSLWLLNFASGCACYKCYCEGGLSGERVVYQTGFALSPPSQARCNLDESPSSCDATPCHTDSCNGGEPANCGGSVSFSGDPTPDPLNAH